MLLFGKKNKNTEPVVQEKEYTCLFCKKKFKANEIEFAMTLNYPDPAYSDVKFNEQLSQYQQMRYRDEKTGKTYGLTAISRRMFDRKKWEVIAKEDNGLPLIIRGPLEKGETEHVAADDGLSFDDDNLSNGFNAENSDEVFQSDERLCPHCHFTLPEGFDDEKVIQIGLLGGSRSGKTTYMAVVTEYLQKKLGTLNSGLELARVELLPESQKYQEALYASQRSPSGAGATPIVGDIKDQMVMPIVIHIKPDESQQFKPFFVIFQDIPGEYLQPKNKKFLINSNIPKSNHLILLVDINHFIKTEQKKSEEFGGYCKQDVSELFTNIDALGNVIPDGQLQSVQCTLTKLDFWKNEEGDRLNGAIFTINCDEAHRQAIDQNRLTLVHDQISTLLNGIGGDDQSGLLDNLLKSMDLSGKKVHYAYTAIASRIVPGYEDSIRTEGADYQFSLNVLEPLMNIFDWEGVLPVKKGGQ